MFWISALAASLVLSSVSAQSAPKCGAGSTCPQDTPCCSQYGECGVGAYCLGGCDPMFSYELSSCAAAPTCQSSDYKLTSLDDIMPNTKYLGNASQANWVSEGQPIAFDNSILLTMAPNTVGTLLSSTHYVWYGKISTTMKSSAGAGVVSAFIMMSDVKDEIDFEFVGADLQAVQSNFYWQGSLNYTNELNLTASSTNTDTHTYTVDWNPDSLTWSIDGNVMRTLNREDTYNSTTNSYSYPQTPARVQLSLWPAGNPANGQGTVEWAGGEIDWNSQYMTNGYYSAQIYEVDVQCYDPPSGANSSGTNSYVYNDNSAGYNNSVAIVDDNTILSSFYATGENESLNPYPSSSTSKGAPSATSSTSPVNTNVQTVPGSSGTGAEGDTGGNPSGGSQSSSGSGGGGQGTGGSFSQGSSSGSGTSDSSSGAGVGVGEDAKKGSGFAVLIALMALVML